MARLVLFGTGDIGRLAHFYFSHDSEHEVVGFAVDEQYRSSDELLGLPVVSSEQVVERFPPDDHLMFVALSYTAMNRLRAAKCSQAKERGYRLASYVSSRCSFLTRHPVGENCLVLEDNTIQPFVEIGDDVVLWSGNHIGHDSAIRSHCFLASHIVISGHCEVGSYTFIGVNATVGNSVKIAEGTLIGAGAVVTKDTVVGGVYVPPRSLLLDKRSDEIGF